MMGRHACGRGLSGRLAGEGTRWSFGWPPQTDGRRNGSDLGGGQASECLPMLSKNRIVAPSPLDDKIAAGSLRTIGAAPMQNLRVNQHD